MRFERTSFAARPIHLLLGTALLAVAVTGAAAEELPPTEKVLVTMRSALADSPELAARTSRAATQAAEIRSSLGAGAPSLAWQREGIGSGLDQRPNAVDYLRVTLPFNPPWSRGAARGLHEATERLLRTGEAAGRLEVAALAGQRWLDLAAETEMAELARTRVARLEKAVAIQSRRHELGEISGSERAQLELELARDRADLRQSETRRFTAEREVAALAPGEFPLPAGGDLGRLVEDTASIAPAAAPSEALLADAPSLELAKIQREIADAQTETQRRTAWGRPEFELEWERIPALAPADGFDAAGFRVQFPLPFGRQGRQKILAAERRAEAASAERDQLRRDAVARLRSASEAARAAESALGSLRETADSLVAWERSLAEQFRLGAVSYVVYLDGVSRLDEIRRTMIETRYTLLAARLELTRLLGTDAYFPLPALAAADREDSR